MPLPRFTMRRRTRRLVVNIACFCAAFFFIIYLNHDQSSNKTFAWTRIRYKTISAKLPEARGICPGLQSKGSLKPALVVARVAADDSQWLDGLSKLYHLCVYTADAPIDTTSRYLQVPANRGHEAMAYLTFLIDNYEHIPAAGAVFVHGSRWAWHNDAPDYDNAALLAALNIPAALEPSGYHNLRCDWSAGMCSPSDALPQGSLETLASAKLEPWNMRAVSDRALPRALAALFGGDAFTAGLDSFPDESASAKGGGGRLLLGRNDAVRAQCCAQFVVARDSVWQHSRDEYVALRQWLLDDSSNSAPREDRISGRILSYMWHILFMKQEESDTQNSLSSIYGSVNLEQLNLLACPRADECYCRLYGRCNLEGCTTPGHCRDQYHLPPDYSLPDDWAASHS